MVSGIVFTGPFSLNRPYLEAAAVERLAQLVVAVVIVVVAIGAAFVPARRP